MSTNFATAVINPLMRNVSLLADPLTYLYREIISKHPIWFIKSGVTISHWSELVSVFPEIYHKFRGDGKFKGIDYYPLIGYKADFSSKIPMLKYDISNFPMGDVGSASLNMTKNYIDFEIGLHNLVDYAEAFIKPTPSSNILESIPATWGYNMLWTEFMVETMENHIRMGGSFLVFTPLKVYYNVLLKGVDQVSSSNDIPSEKQMLLLSFRETITTKKAFDESDFVSFKET